MQAVFWVGVEVAKDAHVLDNYAVDFLLEDVCAWLSTGPHVRHHFATCNSS